MADDDAILCIRPFDHLRFLFVTVLGGLFAACLALAITQANPIGKAILTVLFFVLAAALVYAYYWHIRSYQTYNRSYPHKPGSKDLFLALFVQIFILVAWLFFSIFLIAHVPAFKGFSHVIVTPPGFSVQKSR